jgi:hypothetical protein
MDINARQEQFANAFLLAVAAAAGFAAAKPGTDNDSIDWTLSCRLPRRPKLDVQMKSTRTDDREATAIRFPLRRKNYDDLILTDVSCPRLLVLVLVPPEVETWMVQTAEQLVLRRCGYWLSLAGLPPSDNDSTITVSVPRANILTVTALNSLMQRANDGEAL